MFLFRRPPPDRLARLVDDARDAALTYDEVGATRQPDNLPSGYHHVRASRVVGEGAGAFAAAVEGIRTWQLHRRQGFQVAPGDPAIEPGAVVVSIVPLVPPVRVVAAGRIVWTVDEPGRFGFAYGTLPAHPERGEEAFVVSAVDDRRVSLAITAFSTPRHPLVRAAGPVARRQQARATRGYLDALQAHVAESLASG